MITIKILNDEGKLLHNRQALLAGTYTVETYDNSILKKSLRYFENEFCGGSYYMNDTENLHNVLDTMVIPGKKAWRILTNKQVLNGFSQWDMLMYEGTGKLAWQGTVVLDKDNWEILFFTDDMLTPRAPGTPRPTKYYYGYRSNFKMKALLLMFFYNGDGSFDEIYDCNDNWNCAWRGLSMQEFLSSPIANDFSFDDHPYYKALTPYLPNSEII